MRTRSAWIRGRYHKGQKRLNRLRKSNIRRRPEQDLNRSLTQHINLAAKLILSTPRRSLFVERLTHFRVPKGLLPARLLVHDLSQLDIWGQMP